MCWFETGVFLKLFGLTSQFAKLLVEDSVKTRLSSVTCGGFRKLHEDGKVKRQSKQSQECFESVDTGKYLNVDG